MIPVLTSFLPPSQCRLYIPALFKIWEAFNSSLLDDRLLEFFGELAEEHVAGTAGELGEAATPWKDVGIWTQWEWDFLTGKCMSSTSKTLKPYLTRNPANWVTFRYASRASRSELGTFATSTWSDVISRAQCIVHPQSPIAIVRAA